MVDTINVNQSWQDKQTNLDQQKQALNKIQQAAQNQVGLTQQAWDQTKQGGLQAIRGTSQLALAAQRGRHPQDIAGMRSAALQRGNEEAGFLANTNQQYSQQMGQAQMNSAQAESEVLANQRRLMDAAQASQVRANQSLTAAKQIVADQTTLYNTQADREKAAQAIEQQILQNEDDPAVRQAIQQYVAQLRAGQANGGGLDLPF